MRIPEPPPRHVRDDAPDAEAFRFSDGQTASSLAGLVEALSRATPTVVGYHREHFVPWLRDVVGDEPLARRFAYYAQAGGEPDVLRETLVALGRARLRELG